MLPELRIKLGRELGLYPAASLAIFVKGWSPFPCGCLPSPVHEQPSFRASTTRGHSSSGTICMQALLGLFSSHFVECSVLSWPGSQSTVRGQKGVCQVSSPSSDDQMPSLLTKEGGDRQSEAVAQSTPSQQVSA